MGREFELKFRATPDLLGSLQAAFPGDWQRSVMRTTYYDTPAGDLSRRKWTLRHRLEGDLDVCTLKTPAQGGARGEFEVHTPDIREAIPMLCKLSGFEELAALTASGVMEVCGAAFTRLAKTVSAPGCTAELALDQGKLLGGGRETALCEVEVELKSGSEEAARAFALTLAARFGLQEEFKSKFRRALDLAKGE